MSMDKSLYNAAITGNIEAIIEQIKVKRFLVSWQRTSHRNNILHLASQFGHTEAVQKILSVYPSLLSKVNLDGNSALHLAARGGHSGVVRALSDSAKMLETGVMDKRLGLLQPGLLRCRNQNDDTALHEATRYNHIEVVSMLLEEDDQSTDEYRNKLGETLMYLAVSRGFQDLVDVIVKACKDPAYGGPTGRTTLHAAVIGNRIDIVKRILEWQESLLWKSDDFSRLPIYYAAHLGFINLVKELLSVGESIGYLPCDEGGNNALLVAASAGHISVMNELISHCPSCFENVNRKGRNVLHVAIEHDQMAVIEYLFEVFPTIVDRLIIEKDRYGNTTLHLLATFNCFAPKLIQHPMADKGALNNEGFTPLDLVIYDDDISFTSDAKIHRAPSDPSSSSFQVPTVLTSSVPPTLRPQASTDLTVLTKNKIAKELKHVGAILHKRAAPVPPPRLVSKYFDKDWFENIKKMTENHMIVAALIATIAFTAGFTMPGGYIQSGSQHEGLVVLSTKSIAFQAFIFSDAIALLFSTSALFIYLVSAICDALKFREDDLKANCLGLFAISGLLCNMLGLGAMIVAFITGTYAVLQHAFTLAIGTCVIVSCAFAIHSFVVFVMIKLFLDGSIHI